MAINPLNNSTLRMIGLSSGMDTDSIVQQMMRLHQLKIDSQFRSRTMLQWKQQSLNTIKDQITDFRRTFLTTMGASAMRLSSAYNSTVATVTGKNAGAVSIKTNVSSATGMLKIGWIESLAKATSVSSAASASRTGNGFNLTDKLGTLQLSNGNIAFDSKGEAKATIYDTEILLKKSEIDSYIDTYKTDEFTGADGRNYVELTKDDGKQYYVVMTGDKYYDYINAKLAEKRGTQLMFDQTDYLGREYTKVSINGKSDITLYKDGNNYTFGEAVSRNASLKSAVKFYDSVNIDTGGGVNTAKLLESDNIINWLKAQGADFKADFMVGGETVSIDSTMTKEEILDAINDAYFDENGVNYSFDGTDLININGVDVALNGTETLAQINQKITAAAKADDGLNPPNNDYSIYTINLAADVEINGKAISVGINDTLAGINKKIGTPGDTIEFNFADVIVNGSPQLRVNRNDLLADVNAKIFSAAGDVDTFNIKPDQSNTINGVTISSANIESTFYKSIENSGFVQSANAAPRYLDFEWSKTVEVEGRRYGVANITINGVGIEINSEMTIDDMLRAVNNSAAGVTMSYDRMMDQFKLENKRVGARDMTVGGLQAFGILNGTYNNGDMARVQINGEWVEKDSNTFDFRGVTITLNNVTEEGDEETTVSFKRDATEAIDRIRTFVDAYNTLIKKLEELLTERKSKDETTYKPLTDEEKSLMSEKQIEEWEAIAKKGLLKNDSGLQNLTNSLRNMLFEKITSAGLTPAQIGLTTGRWDQGTGGQIMLDEVALREALEKDPEKVVEVFMGGADSKINSERGLLWKMDDLMYGYIMGTQSSSINNLETSIRRANEQMEKLQDKMWAEEDKLYKKFAAMETALSKLQSQTDWMYAMLGMGNNNNK